MRTSAFSGLCTIFLLAGECVSPNDVSPSANKTLLSRIQFANLERQMRSSPPRTISLPDEINSILMLYRIQPEEILAYNFVFAIENEKGLRSQRVVDRMQNLLRK